MTISLAAHIAAALVAIAITSVNWGQSKNDFQIVRVKLAAAPMSEPKQEQPPAPKPVVEEKTPAAEKPKTEPKPAEVAVKKTDKKPEKSEPTVAQTGDTVKSKTEDTKQEFSNAEVSGAFEDANFDYDDWTQRMAQKIGRNRTRSIRSTDPLSAKVYFRVLRSGRIYNISLRESSGNDYYDRECQEAVRRSDPLPPLPREYDKEEIGISLVFPFNPK